MNGKTAMYNRDLLEERKRKIREAGLELMLFWECDVLAQLEADEEMAAFFASLIDTGPIFPRDGFQVNGPHNQFVCSCFWYRVAAPAQPF